MKETELKVGDLIAYNGKVVKVEGVDPPFFYLKIGYVRVKVRFYDNGLEPIPLTKEILERSGWEVQNTIDSLHIHYILCCLNDFLVIFEDDGRINIAWYNNTNHLKFDNIKYVHQLQHILWALGIDDNLKV